MFVLQKLIKYIWRTLLFFTQSQNLVVLLHFWAMVKETKLSTHDKMLSCGGFFSFSA